MIKFTKSLSRCISTLVLLIAGGLAAIPALGQQPYEDDSWLVGHADGLYLWAWADGNYAAAHDMAEPFSGNSSGWQLWCKTDAMTDQKDCRISSISPTSQLHGGLEVRFASYESPLAVCVEGHDFPGANAMIRIDKLPAVVTNESGCVEAEKVIPQMLLGKQVTVRRVSSPRGLSFDKVLTLKGFPSAVQGITKIRAGTLKRNNDDLASRAEPTSTDHKVDVDTLISSARALDRRCRGTEGADPASPVCAARDDAFLQANRAGMCYGKDSQAGYQYEWHPCGPDSIGRGH